MSWKNQDPQTQWASGSARVKAVEFHPTLPVLGAALFDGRVVVLKLDNSNTIKTFETGTEPVRCLRFIARTQQMICGTDNGYLHVFDEETLERVAHVHAHTDYIRELAVHETQPFVLSASDDTYIKRWDWTQGRWNCTMVYEGHMHFVMSLQFSPRDPNVFATASLDNLIMVWHIGQVTRNMVLAGHSHGINTLDYHPTNKPWIASGSDDGEVRIWDTQQRECLHVIPAHDDFVSCVKFHPQLPILITTGEDQRYCIISCETWAVDRVIDTSRFGRPWCADILSDRLAIGFDRALQLMRLGVPPPVMALEPIGKILMASNSMLHRLEFTGTETDTATSMAAISASPLRFHKRELTSLDTPPVSIHPSPNGQFLGLVSERHEFNVLSTLGWRTKCFGAATAFAWSTEGGSQVFGILSEFKLTIYRTMRPALSISIANLGAFGGSTVQLHSGPLLGLTLGDGSLTFFDWQRAQLVRLISESVDKVRWSPDGKRVALVAQSGLFVLLYHRDIVQQHVNSHPDQDTSSGGVDNAFSIELSMSQSVRDAIWASDSVLLFLSQENELCCALGGYERVVLAELKNEETTLLLGSHVLSANQTRIFIHDGPLDGNISSIVIDTAPLAFKTTVITGDIELAKTHFLPHVTSSESRQDIALFLKQRGQLEEAFELADETLQLTIALELGWLEKAKSIADEQVRRVGDTAAVRADQWQALAGLALKQAHFDDGLSALKNARDLDSQLVVISALGDASKLRELSQLAREDGQYHIAFRAALAAGDDLSLVLQSLCDAGRYAEATLFARTYCPENIANILPMWAQQLRESSSQFKLLDPHISPEEFPPSLRDAISESGDSLLSLS